jgi:hypothetical protein
MMDRGEQFGEVLFDTPERRLGGILLWYFEDGFQFVAKRRPRTLIYFEDVKNNFRKPKLDLWNTA